MEEAGAVCQTDGMTRIGSGQSQLPPASPAGQTAAAAAAGATTTAVPAGGAPSAEAGPLPIDAGRVTDTFDGTRRAAGRNDGGPLPPTRS